MATHLPAVRRPGIAWRTAALRPAQWPWWVQVLVVYWGARLVSAVVLLLVARTQAANLWTPQAPSYAQYTGLMWDASWYREIAEGGYPDMLPTGSDGRVLQSAWAFFPLFPALARALMAVTGAPWQVVAPTLALVAGTGAALVVHQVDGRDDDLMHDKGSARSGHQGEGGCDHLPGRTRHRHQPPDQRREQREERPCALQHPPVAPRRQHVRVPALGDLAVPRGVPHQPRVLGVGGRLGRPQVGRLRPGDQQQHDGAHQPGAPVHDEY